MKLDKLYAQDSHGNTRVWEIEIIDGAAYRTISGTIDGEKVVSKWTRCFGKNLGKKNETSGERQAELEAISKYDKKLKTGYVENIKDIEASSYLDPMLCKNFSDRKDKVVYPCWVDRKYNGMRQITTINGPKTRKGEPIVSAPHIFDSLKGLFNKYPDLMLDGELYNHDYRYKLNELMSLVRKTVDVSRPELENSERIVRYYIYDGYGFNGITKDTKFSDRKKALKSLLQTISYIHVVESYLCLDEEDVMMSYSKFVEDGYEGAVVKINGPYEHKRSSLSLKLKPLDDDEAVILDIKSGDGNWAGAGKVISLRWKDKVFDATFKGTYEQGVKLLEDKKRWIGKTVTFLYNGLTGLGVPNYARVDIDNCIKA